MASSPERTLKALVETATVSGCPYGAPGAYPTLAVDLTVVRWRIPCPAYSDPTPADCQDPVFLSLTTAVVADDDGAAVVVVAIDGGGRVADLDGGVAVK